MNVTNRKYFDMGSHNRLYDLDRFIYYVRPDRKVEWPKWLTCPEHYQVKHTIFGMPIVLNPYIRPNTVIITNIQVPEGY